MRFAKILLVVIALFVTFMVVKNNMTPSNLGVKNGLLKQLSSKPNGVSSQTDDESKYVNPLPFVNDLETTKGQVKFACDQYGGFKVITETDDYMHVVFTTGKMKYHDDVEFFFDVENEIVHFRSQSRIGYSDMGLNRDRYDAIASSYHALKDIN